MSELIEKVARAMCAHEWRRCGASDTLIARKVEEEWWEYEPKARAAIAAVAEWLDTQGDEQWYPGERLREQLEGTK